MEEYIILCFKEPYTIWTFDYARQELKGIKKVDKGGKIIDLDGIRLRFMSDRYYHTYGKYGRRNVKVIDGDKFVEFLDKSIKEKDNEK